MSSIQAQNLATANPPGVISITDAIQFLDSSLATSNNVLVIIGLGIAFLSLVFGFSAVILAFRLDRYLKDKVELKIREHLSSVTMENFIRSVIIEYMDQAKIAEGLGNKATKPKRESKSEEAPREHKL